MNKVLFTAQQIENELGSAYFYRQYIYRLAEEDVIENYLIDDTRYFSVDEVIRASLKRLKEKVHRRFPIRFQQRLRVAFYPLEKKQVKIYIPRSRFEVIVDTSQESEEALVAKLEEARKEVRDNMPDEPMHGPRPMHGDDRPHPHGHPHGPEGHHHEIMKRLERIEELLQRIEERL